MQDIWDVEVAMLGVPPDIIHDLIVAVHQQPHGSMRVTASWRYPSGYINPNLSALHDRIEGYQNMHDMTWTYHWKCFDPVGSVEPDAATPSKSAACRLIAFFVLFDHDRKLTVPFKLIDRSAALDHNLPLSDEHCSGTPPNGCFGCFALVD